jgi:hypothetical protein
LLKFMCQPDLTRLDCQYRKVKMLYDGSMLYCMDIMDHIFYRYEIYLSYRITRNLEKPGGLIRYTVYEIPYIPVYTRNDTKY